MKPRVRTSFKQPIISTEVSFEKQLDIIKAYVVASKEGREPTDYNQVAGFANVAPATVSACNRFFVHVGVIRQAEESNKYLATEQAIEFHRAINWNKEEEAKGILRGLISKTWSWNSAKGYLEVHGSASRKDLIEKLGYDAGADPKKHGVGVGYLIDYMTYCGLLKESDGTFEVSAGIELESSNKLVTRGEQLQEARSGTKDSAILSLPSVPIILSIMISPDTNEEKIRSTIRVVLDEIDSRSRKRNEQGS